ncbi:hypothetical protein [Microbacterium sp. LMI1-1-1.1]|uniref:hypothetical protein n=1 Tax=Microbacterium sp. LMI1-1-1.1 TaxID=3135223 RepID=UPI0034672004
MLLERDLIQSVGFRNVREGDEITVFLTKSVTLAPEASGAPFRYGVGELPG